MWVDSKDCVPLMDGRYWVQTVYGAIEPLEYTHEGGWNTYKVDGKLFDKYAMPNRYIVRWHKVDYPPAIPEEWKKKYFRELMKEGK